MTNIRCPECPDDVPRFGYWMPCKRMMPAEGIDVLTLGMAKEDIEVLAFYPKEDLHGLWLNYECISCQPEYITHWMPLPGGVANA